MIPKTLSASSILVSEACMERWRVENFERTPQEDGKAAQVGTTDHYALEHFVDEVYLQKITNWSDTKRLFELYDEGYIETFRSGNFETDEYVDGKELLQKWYDRNRGGLENEVMSVEKKETFPIKTSVGEIPFTYILDRIDTEGDGVYSVVDYKTIRAIVRPEDMKIKIQPRAYALAVQIKFPDAKLIRVSFDMLRHDGLVGAVFTRDDNIATYRYLQRAAERVIATDESKAEETINEECKWCIKKTTCKTLAKSIAGGSVHGLELEEVARKKLQIDSQLLALKYAQEELDKILLTEAIQQDSTEFEIGQYEVKITSRKTRKANSNAIAHIVGPELTSKYGNFTVTNIDKMLKSGELDPAQYVQVKEQITTTHADPSAKIKDRGSF